MKILLTVSRYPWPPRRGDQVRTVQTVDFLSSAHEVTLLAPEPAAGEPPPPRDLPCRLVTYASARGAALAFGMARSLVGGLPLQSGLYYRPDLSRKLARLAPQADLGILQLVRLAIHLDDFGETPLLVDLIDSLSLNFSRRAELDRPWMRLPLKVEARLLSIWEHRLLERAVGGILVCERDRLALSRRRRLSPEAIARLSVVPLSVRERRVPVVAEPILRQPGDERPILTITGNLGYFVNIDAVYWWTREVWPEIRRRRPDVRLVVAGARPSPRLCRFVAQAGGELVESPPDLRSLLAEATVALAPMRGGSGVPIKILEAWSVGVPVVASPWAALGTGGRPGEELLLAESPAEWTQAIVGLLEDPAARERLAAGARERLVSDHSRERVRECLLSVVEKAVPRAAHPGPAVGPQGGLSLEAPRAKP